MGKPSAKIIPSYAAAPKMEEPSGETGGSTKIHNVRFYNMVPRGIQCMAYNTLNAKLAVCRSDGSIEIWDMEYAPFLEKTIVNGGGGNCKMESVVWAGERLFSAGITDKLIEWDLHGLEQRRVQHVTGNAIWCIDRNPLGSELAIGTEEGFINILDIDCDQLQYKHLFDKQEGRVLCCKYDATGKFLVTGSVGAIRIWDVQSGHAIHRMNVRGDAEHPQVIVWSLQVQRDFRIVSGDSRGMVTIWDGHSASEVESHKAMKADVLAVALNESENLLVCSGVEPVIRIYSKTKITRDDVVLHRLVKYLQRSVHDHDVKALVCVGEKIISGGIDGYLGVSQMTKTNSLISKYGPFLKNPCIAVSRSKRFLLLRYPTYLEVWRLGHASDRPDTQIADDSENVVKLEAEKRSLDDDDEAKGKSKPQLLTLNSQPEKLLELRSKHTRAIVCATMSPDAQWICYSTPSDIRLFNIATKADASIELGRVKVVPEQFCPASHVAFSGDSRQMFLVDGRSNNILTFSIADRVIDFVESIDTHQFVKDHIHLFTVSACGTYVAAAGTDRSIAVWRVKAGKYYAHHLNLPRYPSTPTAFAIHVGHPRIVVSFSDSKVFEYDLENMYFTCSEREIFVANGQTQCIRNILLDERNPDVFIMQNDMNLFVLKKCSPVNVTEDEAIVSKKSKQEKSRKVSKLSLVMSKSFEHYVDLAWMSKHELIAVGVNPVTLIEHLPTVFKQKKFGAS